METELGHLFLDCSARRLEQLVTRIEACLEKLSYEQIWARGSDNENAIGNLVLHLGGNVRQWIGFGVEGQPDTRRRNAEFAARGQFQPAALLETLKATVAEAVSAIRQLPPERLLDTITVQAYTLTVMEAVYHVVEHFSQHTGQIIFATKQLTGIDLAFYRHLSSVEPHNQKTP